MPDLVIEQSTFERLQRHAKPLVDTTDMVVNRALDVLENHERSATQEVYQPITERQIDPRRLPDLTHTKVLDASLDGERFVKPNWNKLVEQILTRVMKRFQVFDELQKCCSVNMVQGRKQNEGYRYLVEIDVSIQGMPSNEACRALILATQRLKAELEITFMWRSKEGAAHPGERACLKVLSK